ncbi:Polyamine transporter 3 [Leucoagaricus sp. SymC.cos]|nr:Polyamine transporter 3 [Leucoagaricus sp. SymC.cos]
MFRHLSLLVYVLRAPNVQTVIVGRFLRRCFSSTGATVVSGLIADIWRGLPMAFFSLISIFTLGVGPVMDGWVEMNPKLEWNRVEWIQMTWVGAFIFVIAFWLPETRSTIVIEKTAKDLRKKTGDLWLGFCWGVFYCLSESVSTVFETLHKFTIGQTIYIWAAFVACLGVFSYLADCYGLYASSALAGQSLARNILGTVFPPFTQQMYRNLTYKWANTLFGCIVSLLMSILSYVYYPLH